VGAAELVACGVEKMDRGDNDCAFWEPQKIFDKVIACSHCKGTFLYY